ncbi:cation:proton antiporter domain-containing protein [Undibacterium macrobrachii]|jgi:CPA2 family monovalent cation:H+ antiporter-2|uniref:Potassium transporter TrkA n=1 Tax=Undibacterium macrobrachii TaxID=1119058 RepID=A0ABQ2XNR5_9BURK|nr:cation:proton antiporter [Undibacterium macrobrachii]GGX24743.1 potassium transporter TrkA [Undibacterium macrobrachii]
MDHHAGLPFLREALLFLILAGILIPLLQRFKINQVLGFLTIGVVLGPFGVAQFAQQMPWLSVIAFSGDAEVQSLAELGVMFLMFLIGLELSAERLWSLRRWVFLGGSAQLLLTAVMIGSLAYWFGNRLEIALLLGLVFSLSSTAIVMQLLTQQRAMASPMGQASFSMLMLQDFAVVPLLILVDLLGKQTTDNLSIVVGMTLLKSLAAVLFIFLVGRRVVAPVFRYFAQQRQPEVFMALTLLVTLGIAGATAAVGLSLALGAFLAGLLLAETEYRHEVEVTIEPFKGLLMGLFFMSVGMGINLAAFAQNYVWILASVLGLVLIKASVVAVIMRKGGLSWGKSIEGGFLLSQGGEFAFVIIGVAATTSILSRDIAQFMLLVVSISLLMTPFFARAGHVLGQFVEQKFCSQQSQEQASLPEELSGHVVIAGFGRVGQLLADILQKQGVAYVAVEHDAHVVANLRKQGRKVFYGNAARPELLRKMHMQHAAALLVTMDQPAAAMHAVLAARSEYPKLPIYVRSRDEIHALELRTAGATAVVPETLEAGLQLSFFALNALSIPEGEINHILDQERELRVSNQAKL